MAHREQLKRGALRAYEAGRLLTAASIALLVLPVVALCALETRDGEACVCIGAVLLGASVLLRWRSRAGALAVRLGLLAGAAPLAAGLFLQWGSVNCVGGSPASWCTLGCLAVAAPSGLGLGRALSRARIPLSTWGGAWGVAAGAASLGCVGVGLAGVLGAAGGLAAGLGLACGAPWWRTRSG